MFQHSSSYVSDLKWIFPVKGTRFLVYFHGTQAEYSHFCDNKEQGFDFLENITVSDLPKEVTSDMSPIFT